MLRRSNFLVVNWSGESEESALAFHRSWVCSQLHGNMQSYSFGELDARGCGKNWCLSNIEVELLKTYRFWGSWPAFQ